MFTLLKAFRNISPTSGCTLSSRSAAASIIAVGSPKSLALKTGLISNSSEVTVRVTCIETLLEKIMELLVLDPIKWALRQFVYIARNPGGPEARFPLW
jgi:hypothetical protein